MHPNPLVVRAGQSPHGDQAVEAEEAGGLAQQRSIRPLALRLDAHVRPRFLAGDFNRPAMQDERQDPERLDLGIGAQVRLGPGGLAFAGRSAGEDVADRERPVAAAIPPPGPAHPFQATPGAILPARLRRPPRGCRIGQELLTRRRARSDEAGTALLLGAARRWRGVETGVQAQRGDQGHPGAATGASEFDRAARAIADEHEGLAGTPPPHHRGQLAGALGHGLVASPRPSADGGPGSDVRQERRGPAPLRPGHIDHQCRDQPAQAGAEQDVAMRRAGGVMLLVGQADPGPPAALQRLVQRAGRSAPPARSTRGAAGQTARD